MIPARTVAADKTLPHQIVLARSEKSKMQIRVTCNCRVRRKQPHFGILGVDGSSVWNIYRVGEHDLRDGPLGELVTGVRRTYAV